MTPTSEFLTGTGSPQAVWPNVVPGVDVIALGASNEVYISLNAQGRTMPAKDVQLLVDALLGAAGWLSRLGVDQ